MNCNETTFSKLEFNLYELLNLQINCSIDDIKKKFKKIVKKFHPDKISDVEEKLYYNITLAHHILSNPSTRNKYDNWLLKSNIDHSSLKNNFNNDINNMKMYFPSNEREAKLDFMNKNNLLAQRHGEYKEDTRNISSIYKDKEQQRNNINEIIKEDFSNMKDFNKKFSERKKNGVYNSNIVKHETGIVAFNFDKNKFAEIKDFDNMYKKDSMIDYAFSLIPQDTIDYGEEDTSSNIKNGMDKYNSTTKSLSNMKITLDYIGI
jgi:curved DNA-binding protein CbpA